jgi:hypothetical protein
VVPCHSPRRAAARISAADVIVGIGFLFICYRFGVWKGIIAAL